MLREQKISWSSGWFAGDLSDGDHFGRSMAALGDLDRDGIGELAVGAPEDDDGGLNRGAVWILFLARNGTVRFEEKISDSFGGFLGRLDNHDRFGASVARLPDLDGDGASELAVGADQDDDGGLNRGAVWVLFLDPLGRVRREQKISQTSGGFASLLRNGDRFGRSVAALGDLDGDGVTELAVGADQDDDGGSNRGAVWILSLNSDGTVKAQRKISGTQGGFSGLLADEDRFGASVVRLGDLDGNRTPELAVGEDQDDDGGSASGAVWIVFLNPNGTVKAQTKIGGASGLALTSFDRLGTSVAAPGDLDGDGVQDLAAGATADDDGGLNRGAVWVLFLNGDGSLKRWRKISSAEGSLAGLLSNHDSFGAALAALADHDGDGKLDLAVGAELDDDGGTDRGAVWVLFLESASVANVTIRNGSGFNRQLLSATRGPVIGSTWEVQIDCRGHKVGVAFHHGVDTPRTGPIVRGFGEWLIDWRRPRIFRGLAHHRGTIVTIRHAIPADPALVGMPFFSQAMVTGKPGPELTNALDGTIAR